MCINDEIYRIISEIFEIPVDEIEDKMTSFQINNWDSLNQLRLIEALERKFSIMLEANEIFRIINIKSIIDIVKGKLNNDI